MGREAKQLSSHTDPSNTASSTLSTGLTLWVAFFALWLFTLYRATHRAFTVEEVHMPGIPFQPGPISVATIVFHIGLSTTLLVSILVSVYEDVQMLWFALPGVLATVVQGILLVTERNAAVDNRQTRRISPYWIAEQWPFALLGLIVGVAGATLWALVRSPYVLTLVGFSAYFLVSFWFYFLNHNEIAITPATLKYVRSFPRLRTFTHSRPRSKNLALRVRRRRSGVYDIHVEEHGQPRIELTACLSPKERLELELEEYCIRTDQ